MKYPTFESWFNEIENYGMRSERFYESLGAFNSDEAKLRNLEIWLRAAFECGREGIDPFDYWKLSKDL